jgi:hypothetical protein
LTGQRVGFICIEPIGFLYMINEILPPLLQLLRLGDLLPPNSLTRRRPNNSGPGLNHLVPATAGLIISEHGQELEENRNNK